MSDFDFEALWVVGSEVEDESEAVEVPDVCEEPEVEEDAEVSGDKANAENPDVSSDGVLSFE